MPHMCRGPPCAAPPHAAPRQRHHDERHSRVRSDVCLTLRSYVPLCVPPERCDAVSLHSAHCPAVASLSFSLSARSCVLVSREKARLPSRWTTAGSLAAALHAGTESHHRWRTRRQRYPAPFGVLCSCDGTQRVAFRPLFGALLVFRGLPQAQDGRSPPLPLGAQAPRKPCALKLTGLWPQLCAPAGERWC